MPLLWFSTTVFDRGSLSAARSPPPVHPNACEGIDAMSQPRSDGKHILSLAPASGPSNCTSQCDAVNFRIGGGFRALTIQIAQGTLLRSQCRPEPALPIT